MDTLAHGLWGGAVFGQKKDSPWKWAFWLGMMPDLLSFGPYFLTHIPDIYTRWTTHHFGPPDHHTIPAYVYHAYNVTHSLVIWAILFGIVWYWRGKIFWPLAAWALHILCDIPLHSLRFFPTPYLWPFHTPFYDGNPWGHKTFMIANYGFICLTYLGLAIFRKVQKVR
jgi:hypothetical protein